MLGRGRLPDIRHTGQQILNCFSLPALAFLSLENQFPRDPDFLLLTGALCSHSKAAAAQVTALLGRQLQGPPVPQCVL